MATILRFFTEGRQSTGGIYYSSKCQDQGCRSARFSEIHLILLTRIGIGQAYEKKQKRGISSSPSGPSLDSYSALLSTLSSSVSSAKHQHSLFTSTRHVTTLYSISGSVGRIADAQWMKTCDFLRRCAANVGPLGEGRSYVEAGWRGGTVVELPLNLPVEATLHEEPSTGPNTLASRNQVYIRPPLPTGVSSTVASPMEQKPPVTTTKAETIPPKPALSSSVDALERVTEELMNSLALPEAKNEVPANKSTASKDEMDTIKIPKPIIESGKTLASSDAEKPSQGPKVTETKNHGATVTSSTGTSTSATTGTTRSGGTETSAFSSLLQDYNAIPESSGPKDSTVNKIPQVQKQSASSEVAVFEPSHTLVRTPMTKNEPGPSTTRDSTASSPLIPKNSGPGTYFPPTSETNESSRSPATPIFAARSTTGSQSPTTATQPPQPNLPHAPMAYGGQAVGRTMSIDSTTSNGSLVAAMRDRYTPSSPPPPPPHPTGRRNDSYAPREREGGKVSDMASRFTPIEGPLPPSTGSSYPRAPSFPVAPPMSTRERADYHFGPGMMNVGDTLPLRTPIRRSSVDEFGSSFAGATQSPGGGRRGDTMPPPDRRQTIMPPLSTRGSGAPQTQYELHLSELELQQREMELDIQRQRLQLAKEREAISAREREREAQDGGSDYHSGREGRGYGDRYGRNRDMPPGDEYPRAGYARDGGYDSPSGQDVYSPSRRYEHERHVDNGRIGTPRLGGNMPDGYRERAVSPTSRSGESPYRDMSTGMGVLGLGLPPGAAPSRNSLAASRESLSQSTSGYASSNLSPPAPQAASKARDPSPRRSAESGRPSEKEKGGTWLGKGLKRFSMPLGNGS